LRIQLRPIACKRLATQFLSLPSGKKLVSKLAFEWVNLYRYIQAHAELQAHAQAKALAQAHALAQAQAQAKAHALAQAQAQAHAMGQIQAQAALLTPELSDAGSSVSAQQRCAGAGGAKKRAGTGTGTGMVTIEENLGEEPLIIEGSYAAAAADAAMRRKREASRRLSLTADQHAARAASHASAAGSSRRVNAAGDAVTGARGASHAAAHPQRSVYAPPGGTVVQVEIS
jgi:hypothetical protein